MEILALTKTNCRKGSFCKLPRISSEILITLPSFSWLIIFFVAPTLIVASFAFRSADIIDGSLLPGFSLESLLSVLQANQTYVVLFRTIWLSLIATALCVIISLPVAYYLALLPKSKQHKCILLILLPFWSSFLVRVFAWKTLLHPEGFLKKFLIFCHLIEPSTSLLYNNIAVIAVMVYSYLPFGILPLYTSAAKFDFHLLEAALDLGASKTQAFFKIFLPTMRGAFVTASVMVLIPITGAYIIPDVVGGVDSEMLGNKIAQNIFTDRNLPEASGNSLLLGIVLTILVAGITRMNKPKKSTSLQAASDLQS